MTSVRCTLRERSGGSEMAYVLYLVGILNLVTIRCTLRERSAGSEMCVLYLVARLGGSKVLNLVM